MPSWGHTALEIIGAVTVALVVISVAVPLIYRAGWHAYMSVFYRNWKEPLEVQRERAKQ